MANVKQTKAFRKSEIHLSFFIIAIAKQASKHINYISMNSFTLSEGPMDDTRIRKIAVSMTS